MQVRARHTGTPFFTYEGLFGPSIPLIDPTTVIVIRINQGSNPITLHVQTTISGSEGSNEFSYSVEENIEVDPEGQPLEAGELLEEVIDSANRCFDSAHRACITAELAFPFPLTPPAFDRVKALQDIENELRTGE
jgi:hypothetical protein